MEFLTCDGCDDECEGATESRKNLEQKFMVQIGKFNPHGINATLFIPLMYSYFLRYACYHQ